MNNTLFHTADWYLFVWLLAHGFAVKQIERNNPSKCQFYFESSLELEDGIQAFWRNETVNLQDFILAIKKAKVLLHADSF